MSTVTTRGVRIETLTLTTRHPRRVPLRSILAIMDSGRLAAAPRARLLAVQDVVVEEHKEAARVLCLNKRLAWEFLKSWAETWEEELRLVFDSPGQARCSVYDLIRVGSFLGRDGGKRAAALTLKLKYGEDLGKNEWLLWLSEECRNPDPTTHVGMLLINSSGKFTQERLLDHADARHVEAMALQLALSQAGKSERRRLMKEFEKRNPIQEVKKAQVKTVVGKKFASEDDFFASFAAASKQKAKTTTL